MDNSNQGNNNQNTSNDGCGCGTLFWIMILLYVFWGIFGSDVSKMLPFLEEDTEAVQEETLITNDITYEETTEAPDPYANKTIAEQVNEHLKNREPYFMIKKNKIMEKNGEWKRAEDIVFRTQFDIGKYCFKSIKCKKNEAEGLLHVWFDYFDRQEEKSVRKKLRKEAIKAHNSIKPWEIKDDWKKLKKIHNYLVKNVTYKENEYDQTIYGAIVKKHCVCTGYACAFAFLAKRAGIDAVIVDGYAEESSIRLQKEYDTHPDTKNLHASSHAWNEITFNGSRYIIDATWDDNDKKDKKGKPYIEYNYFMTSPNTVKGRMSFSEYQKYDEFSGRNLFLDYNEVPKQGKDNYFVREGIYLRKYKRKSFQSMLREQFKKGTNLLTVRIGSKSEAVASEKDLIKNGNLNDVIRAIGYKKNDWRYTTPFMWNDPDCLDWAIYLYPRN